MVSIKVSIDLATNRLLATGDWPLTIAFSYQDDLETPGTSPRNANPRKHNRQMPNLRKYPLGRPHRRQRLRCRTENLGFFSALALWDVLAMYIQLFAFTFQFGSQTVYGRNGMPRCFSRARA